MLVITRMRYGDADLMQLSLVESIAGQDDPRPQSRAPVRLTAGARFARRVQPVRHRPDIGA